MAAHTGVSLAKVKETKNTIRYEAHSDQAYVTTLYVSKEGVEALGLGDNIIIALTNEKGI